MPRATLHKQNLKLHKNRFLFSGSAVIFTTLLGLFTVNFFQIFASDNSYAETHTDSASGAYNGTTYSVTTTVSDLNLELYNVTPAGKATYGKQTVNVTTNAPGGYQLYVQTSGNLAGTKEGTATSDSIAALPSNNAALDMNTWGYTKTTPNEDANIAATESIWNTPPSTITQVDAASSAAASGRDTDIYYGIKADNTLSGDNYSGTITYTTIANDATTDTLLSVSPTSGNAGTATTITVTTSLMTTSTGITASDISAKVGSYTCSSVSITSTAPLKFTCKTSTSLTAGTYTVTATISKYGKTYTKTSAYTAITPTEYMQNLTASWCASKTAITSSSSSSIKTYTYEVVDNRTSEKYWIRKFGSLCWMVENLYIPSEKTLTSSNTNMTASSYTMPTSSTSGFSDNSTKYMYSAGRNRNGFKQGKGNYAADGSYFSWVAAKVGVNTTGTDNDVCPKNWHMPTYAEQQTVDTISEVGGSINNFYADSTGIAIAPVLPGYHYGAYTGYPDFAGTGAYWWSSTQYGSTGANFLFSSASSLSTSNNGTKRLGYSVRCVLPSS